MKHNKNCSHCGEIFISKRSDAKFCSHSCRQLNYMYGNNTAIPEQNTIPNNAPVNYLSKKPDILRAKASLPSIYSGDTARTCQLPVNSEIDTDVLLKESERKNTANVNKHLKQWIDELLSFEKKGEVSRSNIRFLLLDINRFFEV